MVRVVKTDKPGQTDLTWEDRNPSSYLLSTGIQTKLDRTLKKVKEEIRQNTSKKDSSSKLTLIRFNNHRQAASIIRIDEDYEGPLKG